MQAQLMEATATHTQLMNIEKINRIEEVLGNSQHKQNKLQYMVNNIVQRLK